jgi:hypothetical protein
MTSSEQNKPEEIESEEVDFSEFEFATTTAAEYISSAFYALNAVNEIDTAIVSREDERRINRIKKKSLKIIDQCISDLYDEMFDDGEEKPQP